MLCGMHFEENTCISSSTNLEKIDMTMMTVLGRRLEAVGAELNSVVSVEQELGNIHRLILAFGGVPFAS